MSYPHVYPHYLPGSYPHYPHDYPHVYPQNVHNALLGKMTLQALRDKGSSIQRWKPTPKPTPTAAHNVTPITPNPLYRGWEWG